MKEQVELAIDPRMGRKLRGGERATLTDNWVVRQASWRRWGWGSQLGPERWKDLAELLYSAFPNTPSCTVWKVVGLRPSPGAQVQPHG